MSSIKDHQKARRLPGCMILFFGMFGFAGFAVLIGAGILPLINGEGNGEAIFAIFFSLPFIAIGVGGLYFFFRQRSSNPLSNLDQQALETRDKNYNYGSREQLGPDDELELKSENSPLGRVIALFFFAAIWNGITSIPIISEIIPGFQSGDIDWFLTIFISIFALIGIVMIGLFFHSLLALKNPRPMLRLHTNQPRTGQTLTLYFEMIGDPHRISTLTFTLVGTESATYRRGTDTVTSTETFFEKELLEIQDSVDMRSGSLKFALPSNTMPSWKSDNNEIKWQLKLNGDIPGWPDISETYELPVYPELRT